MPVIDDVEATSGRERERNSDDDVAESEEARGIGSAAATRAALSFLNPEPGNSVSESPADSLARLRGEADDNKEEEADDDCETGR